MSTTKKMKDNSPDPTQQRSDTSLKRMLDTAFNQCVEKTMAYQAKVGELSRSDVHAFSHTLQTINTLEKWVDDE